MQNSFFTFIYTSSLLRPLNLTNFLGVYMNMRLCIFADIATYLHKRTIHELETRHKKKTTKQ